MKLNFKWVSLITLLVFLMSVTNLPALATSVDDDGFVEYVYDGNGIVPFGNNPPTNKLNLTTSSSHKYTANWPHMYQYTYTNTKVCTGNSNKKFKIVLNGHCRAESSDNEKIDGKYLIEMYNSSGFKVAAWQSSTSSDPSFTKYFKAASASSYYYFKISLKDCVGWGYGKLKITLVDK